MNQPRPVGRFAPTPSGRMHLGNAFAALLAWLSVRHEGGELILRMEDLDFERSRAEYARDIRRELEWLGLDWDRETQMQSQRSGIYDMYFQRLEQMGIRLFDFHSYLHLTANFVRVQTQHSTWRSECQHSLHENLEKSFFTT